MSNRQDKEREARLEPSRIAKCKETLEDMGFSPTIIGKAIIFHLQRAGGNIVAIFRMAFRRID